MVFSLLVIAMGVSRLADGDGTVPTLGALAAFVFGYLLVGLGEETLRHAVLAETLLERSDPSAEACLPRAVSPA